MISLEQSLADIRTTAEARAFMRKMWTAREIKSFQHRWRAFQLILEGAPQRTICKTLRMSSTTVSRAARVARTDPNIIKTLITRRRRRGDGPVDPSSIHSIIET